jgi:amino acid transporter
VRLVLYGLGTIVGAGIYALMGKVAGVAGLYAPFAFAFACGLAAFTALSLAELSSRFPRAAGEAAYVHEGFGRRDLATLVGLLMVAAGCISAATVARGFVGYVSGLLWLPPPLWIALLILGLGALAAWGIREAAWAAAAMTVIEIGGLLLVTGAAGGSLAELSERWPELVPPLDPDVMRGILGASLLCFYAFIGFEDMVNVAEEVRDVRRVLPRAILTTLVVAGVLYLALSVVSVLAVPPHELAESEAPLALLWERASGRSPVLLELIGVFALANGALIQMIKASRILYGLANQGALQLPWLARVHPRTRTPLHATGLVIGIVLGLALGFPLATLAEATSMVTLAVFALINAALWRLKRTRPQPTGTTRVPTWVPAIGFCVTSAFLIAEVLHRLPLG